MTYRDLTDESKRGALLVCMAGCAGEYSAHAGDYWWADLAVEIACRCCGGPMMRVLRQTRYVGV